jgi:uncharacterized membrane protein
MIYIKLVALLTPIMLAIDVLWIGVFMKSFYRENLGYIMADTINWKAGLIFYVLYIFGLIYFVIIPEMEGGTLISTALKAALFGFIAYATYDLTNQATLKDWPLIVTVIDMSWGAFVTGVMGAIGFFIVGFLS